MKYRPDIDKVLSRMNRFYNSDKGGALIQIDQVGALMQHMGVNLTQWDFPGQLQPYLDNGLAMYEKYWEKRIGIEDDMIPAVHPWFGIAELSAYVGGDVDLSEATSWHHPVVKEWNDLDSLELREDNPWFRMVIDGMAYLQEKSDGDFAVMLRGAEGPMDLANAVRGNDFFTDLALDPENTHKLLDFTTEAATWFLKCQQKALGSFRGGYISGFETWIPGNAVGHIAEDAMVMCSGDMYLEFGKPRLEELCRNFDTVMMHTHSAAGHNIPNIVDIPAVKLIEITDDPNAPRAIELCKDLGDILADTIVVLKLTKEELLTNLNYLKDRKTIIKYQAIMPDEAKEIVDIVRDQF